MIDTKYNGYLINLKLLPQHSEWLVTVRDYSKTILTEWHDTKEDGKQWAKNLIENINQ